MSKIVLITGASSGFGLDTAATLAAEGHRVFASMRDVAGRNKAAADSLRSKGIEVLELDVTNDVSVDAAFKTLFAATGGKLDVLVNNAGLFNAGISETFTPEQLRSVFEVNVIGVQRVSRAALPNMRKNQSGLIINLGSVLGRVTFPFFGLYGATKFALEALTDSYRYELSQLGVDVVLVQPSAYPTNLFNVGLEPADSARAESYGPVAAIPGKMFESFDPILNGPNKPDPHDVSVAIATLVKTAQGKRPDRVVVGTPFGADAANNAIAPIQKSVVESLGLSQLAQARVQELTAS